MLGFDEGDVDGCVVGSVDGVEDGKVVGEVDGAVEGLSVGKEDGLSHKHIFYIFKTFVCLLLITVNFFATFESKTEKDLIFVNF